MCTGGLLTTLLWNPLEYATFQRIYKSSECTRCLLEGFSSCMISQHQSPEKYKTVIKVNKIIEKLPVKAYLALYADTNLEHDDFRFAVKCTTLKWNEEQGWITMQHPLKNTHTEATIKFNSNCSYVNLL